jgi:hypothetical protein
MNSTLTWRNDWRSGAPPAAAVQRVEPLAQRRQRGIDERVAEMRPLRLEAGDGGFDLSLFGRHVGAAWTVRKVPRRRRPRHDEDTKKA